MTDIYVGLILMTAVSVLFYFFSLIVVSRFRRRIADFFGLGIMIGMILYLMFLWDKAQVTWFVPYSNAIIVGNWFPVITAMLSAVVYHRIRKKGFRKYAPVVLLNIVGAYSVVYPVLGSPPACEDQVDDLGVARQSSQVTCSPTSAVNLLKYYQIESSESEMARLCLTRSHRQWLGINVAAGGTSWLGLYRGLKIKLHETDWRPFFFRLNFDEFMSRPYSPCIASLRLPSDLATTDPEQYLELESLGWRPGLEHNVVFQTVTNRDSVFILDPKVGMEEMSLANFQALWVGKGMFIEKR